MVIPDILDCVEFRLVIAEIEVGANEMLGALEVPPDGAGVMGFASQKTLRFPLAPTARRDPFLDSDRAS